jgi:isocitrate dehydrogenase
VQGSDTVTFKAPAKPTEPIAMHTFTGVRKEVVGLDLYIDASEPAASTAPRLEKLAEGSPFRLTLISCRGTQVWPRGSVFTEVVDYWRVRFELRDGVSATQADAVRLLQAVAGSFVVSESALLRTFDGVRGFSLAQGQ